MRNAAAWVIFLSALFLAGCGGGVQQSTQPRAVPSISGGYGEAPMAPIKPGQQAQAVEAQYHGRRALKLTNGLVTVVAVPELGGRIMEYKIGSKPLLWVNEALLSGGASAGKWANWGGYKVWPAPQSRWGGPPDPPGSHLDGGTWTGRIVKARGDVAEIELTSPADRQVTGLQIIRRVRMFAGTTRVQITETFRNVGSRDVEWAIWGIAQVPGSLASTEQFSEDSRIYLPLSRASRFEGGYRQIVGSDSSQWRPVAGGRVLEVGYRHVTAKIGADADEGWICWVDDRHDWAFVQRFEIEPGANYPDGGCSVEVFTSGDAAYMEAEFLSPLKKLRPGERFSFTVDWYATRLGGPVVAVTDGAAVSEPVVLKAEGGRKVVSGVLGVFWPGKLVIVPLDASAKLAGKRISLEVQPDKMVKLSRAVEADADATQVVVKLEGKAGNARLATLPLPRSQTRQARR